VRHNTKVVHLVVALPTVKAYSNAANCAVKVASDCLLIGLVRFDKLTPYGIMTVRYCWLNDWIAVGKEIFVRF